MQSLGSPLEGSDKPVEAADELVAMGDIVNARAVEKKLRDHGPHCLAQR